MFIAGLIIGVIGGVLTAVGKGSGFSGLTVTGGIMSITGGILLIANSITLFY